MSSGSKSKSLMLASAVLLGVLGGCNSDEAALADKLARAEAAASKAEAAANRAEALVLRRSPHPSAPPRSDDEEPVPVDEDFQPSSGSTPNMAPPPGPVDPEAYPTASNR